MPRVTLHGITMVAGLSIASVASALAQQKVVGHGSTCTATNKRCYQKGGNAGICEPKLAQCLQTGTYYGNNYTISNLKKQ
jgi:hypothetical protein